MPFIPDKVPVKSGFIPDKKSVGGFLGNVVKSTGRTIGDIGSSLINVFNPNPDKNTVKNLDRLSQGAFQLLIPGEQGNEQVARNVGEFYKNRYGNLDKIGNTLYNDPVGVALDASTLASGVGAGAKALGLGKTADIASTIARVSDPLAIIGKGVSKVTEPIKGLVGKGVAGLDSEALLTKGLGNPARQQGIIARGSTPGELIKKYNLFDREAGSAGMAKKGVFSERQALIDASKVDVDTAKIIEGIDKKITELSTGDNAFSQTTKSTVKELQKRRNDIVSRFGETGTSTISEIDAFRRNAIDPDITAKFFSDAKQTGKNTANMATRDIFKEIVNSADPRIKQLGLDYGSLKELEKVFKSYQSRVGNRQMFNFTKLGGAGVGALVAGAPGAIGTFIVEQFVNSPEFLKYASKASDAVKSVKTPSIFSGTSRYKGGAYQLGKVGRLFQDRTTD